MLSWFPRRFGRSSDHHCNFFFLKLCICVATSLFAPSWSSVLSFPLGMARAQNILCRLYPLLRLTPNPLTPNRSGSVGHCHCSTLVGGVEAMHGWAPAPAMGVRMGVAKMMSDSEGMVALFSSFYSCNYREMTAFLMVLWLLANATMALRRG